MCNLRGKNLSRCRCIGHRRRSHSLLRRRPDLHRSRTGRCRKTGGSLGDRSRSTRSARTGGSRTDPSDNLPGMCSSFLDVSKRRRRNLSKRCSHWDRSSPFLPGRTGRRRNEPERRSRWDRSTLILPGRTGHRHKRPHSPAHNFPGFPRWSRRRHRNGSLVGTPPRFPKNRKRRHRTTPCSLRQ